MKFWDTSAVVPLLMEEEASAQVDAIFFADPVLVVWWGTSIECVSALSRLEREGKLTPKESIAVVRRLDQLRETWREIQASQQVKQTAERILRLHPLRAQDAQQLAACIVANQDHAIELVTLDARLEIAARKEGLAVAIEL